MIIFRKLEKSDFSLLHKWLNVDFVSKWYERRKFIYDDVERKYSSHIKIDTPVSSFIVTYENNPIGYIQSYPIHAYQEYVRCLRISTNTVGLDMFIGELEYTNKGLGTEIVSQFVKLHVFTEREIVSCISAPEPENMQAIRVYEKAGFQYLKTVYCGKKNQAEYIMILRKNADHVVYNR